MLGTNVKYQSPISHSGVLWWWPIGMSPTYVFCRQHLKMVTIIKSPTSLGRTRTEKCHALNFTVKSLPRPSAIFWTISLIIRRMSDIKIFIDKLWSTRSSIGPFLTTLIEWLKSSKSKLDTNLNKAREVRVLWFQRLQSKDSNGTISMNMNIYKLWTPWIFLGVLPLFNWFGSHGDPHGPWLMDVHWFGKLVFADVGAKNGLPDFEILKVFSLRSFKSWVYFALVWKLCNVSYGP